MKYRCKLLSIIKIIGIISLISTFTNPLYSNSANHSLILKSDGSLHTFGFNVFGQLGDGTTTTRNTPTQILASGVSQIAGSVFHSMVLKSDGSLHTFGYGFHGQLGDGTTTTRNTPTQILASGISQIAAGLTFSLILKSDGSLHTFGNNTIGQLGDGSTTTRNTPTQILASGVSQIAAGGGHSLILKSDGSLHTFGNNTNGQLGDGSTTQRNTPTQILASGVSQIAAGTYHSLILKSDGSLHTFGKNTNGQLGDGTTSDKNTPTQILASGVAQIAAGGGHSLILKSDGSLHTFGMNNSGQLGDGTTSDKNTPTQILSSGVARLSEQPVPFAETFTVSGGQFGAPYYTFTDSLGNNPDMTSFAFHKGSRYLFTSNNISISHPFMMGTSRGVSSPIVNGGPLNSAGNGHQIIVDIPQDFNSTLVYYCTNHAGMIQNMNIASPGSGFLPVYNLSSPQLTPLVNSANILAGNYSVVEEMNSSNQLELRIRPVIQTNGNWVHFGANQFYRTKPSYPTLSSVQNYLTTNGINAVNAPNMDAISVTSPGNGSVVSPSNDNLSVYITYQSSGGGYQTPTWAYRIDSGFPGYGSPHGGIQVTGKQADDILVFSDQTQDIEPTNAASNAGQIFTAGVSGKLAKVMVAIAPNSSATVKIREFSSNTYSNMFNGTLLATSETASDLPSGPYNYRELSTFNFTNMPTLSAGQKYVIQVLGATAYEKIPSTGYSAGHSDSGVNTGYGSNNGGPTSKDLRFQTHMLKPYGTHQLNVALLDANGNLHNPPVTQSISVNYQSPSSGYQSGSGGYQSPSGGTIAITSPSQNGQSINDSNDNLSVSINYQSPSSGYQTPTWAYRIDSGFPGYGSPHGGILVTGTHKNNFLNGQSYGNKTVYVTLLDPNGNLLNPPVTQIRTLNYQSPSSGYQSGGGGYLSPGSEYSSPTEEYSSPDTRYQSPGGGYSTPSSGYSTASDGYSNPGGNYISPGNSYVSPNEGYSSPGGAYLSPNTGYNSQIGDYSSPSSGYSIPKDDFTGEENVPSEPTLLKSIVNTISFSDTNNQIQLTGKIIQSQESIGLTEQTTFGFLISPHAQLELTKTSTQRIRGTTQPDGTFSATYEKGSESILYFRAFAENGAGITLGRTLKIEIENEIDPAKMNLQEKALSDLANGSIKKQGDWLESPWFGDYKDFGNGWIYHHDHGWLYLSSDGFEGIWAWSSFRGWVWSTREIYPFLYQSNIGNWIYCLSSNDGQVYYFNYSTNLFEENIP